MATHEELLAEMPKLEKLSNAQRLKHAKKRRQKQLKKWQDTERALRQSQLVEASVTSSPRVARELFIAFDEDSKLRDAISRNDLDEARMYLESGVSPNISNADGLSPLHMCCIEENAKEMAAMLVEFKADLESRDIEGWTPLHAAANCGNLHMINFLLDQGASLVAINIDDKMPIDVAADSDIRHVLQGRMTEAGYTDDVLGYIRASVAKTMLADLKDSVRSNRSLDLRDKYGSTAAHVAACNGYVEVLQFLMDHKADLGIHDNEGWTPLHSAAHWEQPKVILMLARAKVDLSPRNLRDETPFNLTDSGNIRKLLVDLQNGEDIDKLEQELVEDDDGANTAVRKNRSMSVRRGSQKDKDGMQRSDQAKEAEMRRVSLAEMDAETQDSIKALQDRASMADDSPAAGNHMHEATGTESLLTLDEDKVELIDDKKNDDGETTEEVVKKQPSSRIIERPKSVLKKTEPTPVYSSSTTPNPTDRHSPSRNAHQDRECCSIM